MVALMKCYMPIGALEELCLQKPECCITLSTVLPLLSLFQQLRASA